MPTSINFRTLGRTDFGIHVCYASHQRARQFSCDASPSKSQSRLEEAVKRFPHCIGIAPSRFFEQTSPDEGPYLLFVQFNREAPQALAAATPVPAHSYGGS
jgi:hypothetical protein